jgi:predicted ABC-type ATPase
VREVLRLRFIVHSACLWKKVFNIGNVCPKKLPDAETAIARVAERVCQGGHDIPDATIRRRFDAGLKHFHRRYKPLVDIWLHFDNAGDTPVLVDWSEQ